MLIRRWLVAGSLFSLLTAGLAALPSAVAVEPPADEPGLLEPEDVPLVPAVPLDDLKYERAESDRAPSLPLPDDVDDLPSDVSATVPVGESWTDVPEAPVEVMVEEPATDQPDSPVGPNSQDEPGSNVPDGADVEVDLIRPEDLDRAVLLLDLGVSPDAPVTPPAPEDPEPSEQSSPSEEPAPTEGEESPEAEGPSGSPEESEPTPDAPETTTEPEEPAEPEGSEPPSDTERVPAEGVSVRISYADFEQLYGGRWSDRLEVRAYPACFATTPEEPACAVGTPVESVNDAGAEELSFTTVPAATVAESVENSEELTPGELSKATDVLAAAGGSGVVYALAAGEGKFDAVPFNTATSWQAGTGSGEFSYSYPFELPEALGGATPSLSLNYSSATVDAMTAENSQATGSGTGWSDLTPGFITRSFASCEDDQADGAHEFDDRGDLCWATREDNGQEVEELSLSMNGRSSKLRRIFQQGVDDPGAGPGVQTHEYRLYDDPGWRVLRRFEPQSTPVPERDNDRERWLVITPDGTRYHFGARNDSGAESVWTVPVFGNDAGEPCHAGTLAGSVCEQAWQWNLDRVVDRQGNEIHYGYQIQTNAYDQYGAAEDSAYYVRAGMLDRIEYGFWSDPDDATDSVGPPRQVVEIATSHRCLDEVIGTSTCADPGPSADPTQWPDVPLDLICATDASDCLSDGPAFFNTERYWKVETSTRQGAGTGAPVPVATYTLGHTLPDVDGRTTENDDDGEQADLWLQSVRQTGHIGGANTQIPHAYFEGEAFPNRVDTPAGEDSLKKFRIFAVRNELGGRIDVSYGHAAGRECTPAYVNGLAGGDETKSEGRWLSARECFTGRNAADDGFEWFHKYMTTRVAQSDDALHYRVGNPSSTPSLGSVRITDYEYNGDPAWRYRNSRNIKRAKESWDDWRGYEETNVYQRRVVNQAQSGTHSINRTVRFRGMNRSLRNPDGTVWTGRRINTVEANDGGEGGDPGAGSGPVDEPWLNGMVAETSTLHPDGTLIERTYTGYKSYNLNTPSNIGLARRVWTARTTTTTRTASGTNPGQRRHTIRYGTHEGGADHRGILAGAPKWASDQGDDSLSDNETCSTTDWKTNPDLWMMAELQTRLYAGACGTDGAPTGDLAARTQKFYDHEEDTPANPLTLGELTRTTVHTGPGDTDAVKVNTETDYDVYGRVVETRDPRGNPTTTEYNPSGSPANLLTELKVTQVQDPGPDLVTTTTMEPAKGLPTEVIDPNGGSTRMTYDGLGRPLKMFAPRNNSSTPTIEHEYQNSLRNNENDPVSEDKPALVITRTQLGSPSSTTTVPTVTFYDGWGRTIETQQASPVAGRRLVTSTGYDDRGLARLSTAAYSSTQPNVGEIVNPAPATLPRYSLTSYDPAQRPVEVRDMTLGTEYRKATTSHLGDATVQVPPGSGATRTVLDAWNRPTRVELHQNAAGTNLEDAADYAYTTTGQLDTITKKLPLTGPSYTWDYDYDWANRKTRAEDPDTGIIEYTYDKASNPTEVVTRNLDILNTVYSRITTEFDDLNRPTVRRDATTSTPGRALAEWTYDTAPNGLGRLAEVTSTTYASVLEPGLIAPLSNSWTHTKAVTGYDADGNAVGTRVRYPSWLTGETATVGNDVEHTFGYTSTATGEPAAVTYPQTPGFGAGFTIDYSYEPTGGRLARMKAGANQTVADARYDAVGQPSTVSTYNTTDATLIRTYLWEPHTGRPTRVVATTAGPGTSGGSSDPGTTNPVNRLDLRYKYDLADNPVRTTATVQATPGGATVDGAWCYAYDGLNRLTRAYNSLPTAPRDSTTTCQPQPAPGSGNASVVTAVTGPLHDLGYAYAADRLSQVKTPGVGTATGTATYLVGNTAYPHRTTNIQGSGAATAAGMPATGQISYNGIGLSRVQPGRPVVASYDKQGRLTQATSNPLASDPGLHSQYAYDADGMRIARRTVNKDTDAVLSTTVYLPDGTEITRNNLGGPTSVHHLTTPGGTPLTSIEPGGATWAFADPQGTIRFTRAPTGTPNWLNYYPHGDPTTTGPPTTPANRGYLNKTHDPNGDLRLDQRNYTPTLNILTTPDPILTPADPQSANPYAYARNNPITLSDPSGLDVTCTSSGGGCSHGGVHTAQPPPEPEPLYTDRPGLGAMGCGSSCDGDDRTGELIGDLAGDVYEGGKNIATGAGKMLQGGAQGLTCPRVPSAGGRSCVADASETMAEGSWEFASGVIHTAPLLIPVPGGFVASTALKRLVGSKVARLIAMAASRRGAAQGGDEAFHYTSSRWIESITTDGLRKGAYASPNGSLSPLQASLELALPPNRALPNAVIRIDLAGLRKAGYEVPTATRVSSTVTGAGGRTYSMPGGGYEIQFPYSIPSEFLKVVPR